MSINVEYAIRDSFANFRRNWVMSLGAVVTIFLSLLVIGVFLIGGALVNSVVDSVEDKVSIQVFLSDNAPQEEVISLQGQIEANAQVKSVSYTSKEQALENFKETMSDNPGVVDGLDGQNPLPASLDVELVDPQAVQDVAAEILENPTFLAVAATPDAPAKDLRYGQDIVDRLFTITNWIRLVGAALIVLLIVVAMIFINNTIRLAIYARRKEIGVMRLVGASNGFIRAPFLVEGALQALIGAILAVLCMTLLTSVMLPKVSDAITWLPVAISNTTQVQIYVTLVVAGILMGLFGSAMAMRRYLKI